MIELTLPDMSCGHCVATVQKTLLQLDPQARVQVGISSLILGLGGRAGKSPARPVFYRF